jgi:hypothetical protein
MKKFFYSSLILLSLLIAGITGCKQPGCTEFNACNYDADAEKNDGSCVNKGKVTFWQSTATSYNYTDVTINGQFATITQDLSATPACDASGCANFSLCPGSYSYSAVEQSPGTAVWNGTVTVTSDGCMRIELQ